MHITFAIGTTATKVGDKKPTRFYGGETADIVKEEAEAAIRDDIAIKAGTKEAKALAAKLGDGDPRTRRQNLDARTPGLEAKLAQKRALAALGQEALEKQNARKKGDRLADLGKELNGTKASKE